jgi:hypothetical protein
VNDIVREAENTYKTLQSCELTPHGATTVKVISKRHFLIHVTKLPRGAKKFNSPNDHRGVPPISSFYKTIIISRFPSDISARLGSSASPIDPRRIRSRTGSPSVPGYHSKPRDWHCRHAVHYHLLSLLNPSQLILFVQLFASRHHADRILPISCSSHPFVQHTHLRRPAEAKEAAAGMEALCRWELGRHGRCDRNLAV